MPTASVRSALVVLLVVLWPGSVTSRAEDIRHETGRRLQLFERAWKNTADVEARRRALVPLKLSVNQFLGGKQLDAARSLDAARFALRWTEEAPEDFLYADSLMIVPARRLVDAANKSLSLSIAEFYSSGVSRADGAQVEITLLGADGAEKARASVELDVLPATADLPLVAAGEGDFRLHYRVLIGERELSAGEYRLSLVSHLNERLDKLTAATTAFPEAERNLDKLSAAGLTKLLASLVAGAPNETDYPAARLLAEAEDVVRVAERGQPYYGPGKDGQFWLRAGTPRQELALRIFVPEQTSTKKSLPLVIALHGAGGSENLFFDGYGAGLIAELCRERGWLVVSPRTAGFGLLPIEALVDTLAAVYPIDRQRVFIVGHSMGAMQASAAALARPEMFAAVAALGGGGAVKPSPALTALPYFVAAGSQDFALSGARRLAENLRGAGVERVVFKEYPDVEHLLIVQEALPEVFAFFDAAAAR